MNAGFHDAVGLAWRSAMTLAGQAAPAVLDSYGEERQGERARLDAQQAKGFRQVVYRKAGRRPGVEGWGEGLARPRLADPGDGRLATALGELPEKPA